MHVYFVECDDRHYPSMSIVTHSRFFSLIMQEEKNYIKKITFISNVRYASGGVSVLVWKLHRGLCYKIKFVSVANEISNV